MTRFHVLIVIALVSSPQLPQCEGRGVNGGIPCGVCTVLVGLFQQLAQVHVKNITDVVEHFCSYLPAEYVKLCDILIEIWGPAIIEKLVRGETSDVICYSLGICHVDPGEAYCHLFPEPKEGMEYAVEKSKKLSKVIPFYSWEEVQKFPSICELRIVRYICSMFEKIFNLIQPAIDVDSDKYSVIGDLRGSSWRGRDCDDFVKDVHPGRNPIDGDRFVDSNCNGISGEHLITAETYENELCGGTEQYGLIYIGDSVGAHCHVPPQWLTAKKISQNVFKHLVFILGNELDWPETSFATGYRNITWPTLNGYTDSLYLRLRNHNLCNHRDYENLAVNGASSADIEYLKGIARNKTTDKPAIVFYAMMGNDVCTSYMSSLNNLTTTHEFKENVLKTLEILNGTLPAKSHVILVGLVDGKFIYPTMKSHYHPLGQLNRDITYDDLYSWFNCMKIGPCYGWMNKNETIRNATSKRAAELTDALRKIVEYRRYESFQLHFIENPIHKVFKLWTMDHELWQLLEPVDSLHPIQEVQPYITKVVWKELMNLGILTKPNPNNKRIKMLFGDQGGH